MARLLLLGRQRLQVRLGRAADAARGHKVSWIGSHEWCRPLCNTPRRRELGRWPCERATTRTSRRSGNPKPGMSLMQSTRTMGIDLPLRFQRSTARASTRLRQPMKNAHMAVHKKTASQGQCCHSPPQLSTFLGKTKTQASFGLFSLVHESCGRRIRNPHSIYMGERGKNMRLASLRPNDVLHANASYEKCVANQRPMTSPRNSFGAHQHAMLDGRQVHDPLDVLCELRRLHVIRITAE